MSTTSAASFRSTKDQRTLVLVPIANGTESIEAIVPIDILQRAGVEVIVASVENQLQIEVTYGIKIVADALISDCVDTEIDLISLLVSCIKVSYFHREPRSTLLPMMQIKPKD
ncbi:hypothetical protein H5410_022327 [Solanum commersonii]|uniref:DJ-1/PfpI domain-containing protein n=1 Tax=Solanum commersonii TaxID=4109 RepID=A0A9J5ZJ49_SOLCO|nr:hypothetical protein H5410_022327 [Solanum commersonii]